jgi:phosphomannomutase
MADRVYNGMPASELPDLKWRLAAGADGGAAGGVEMARLPDGQVAVRNAADPEGPALIYTKAEIEALIGGAQDGDFDALLS